MTRYLQQEALHLAAARSNVEVELRRLRDTYAQYASTTLKGT